MDYNSLKLKIKMVILDNAVKEYQKDSKTIYVVIKESGMFERIMDKIVDILKETIGKLERQNKGLVETIEVTEMRERETIIILNKENKRLRQIIKEGFEIEEITGPKPFSPRPR